MVSGGVWDVCFIYIYIYIAYMKIHHFMILLPSNIARFSIYIYKMMNIFKRALIPFAGADHHHQADWTEMFADSVGSGGVRCCCCESVVGVVVAIAVGAVERVVVVVVVGVVELALLGHDVVVAEPAVERLLFVAVVGFAEVAAPRWQLLVALLEQESLEQWSVHFADSTRPSRDAQYGSECAFAGDPCGRSLRTQNMELIYSLLCDVPVISAMSVYSHIPLPHSVHT